jgi:hypothetical protein
MYLSVCFFYFYFDSHEKGLLLDSSRSLFKSFIRFSVFFCHYSLCKYLIYVSFILLIDDDLRFFIILKYLFLRL